MNCNVMDIGKIAKVATEDEAYQRRIRMNKEHTDDSYFLCRRSETAELIKKAEQERDNLLNELKTFYTGNIGIRIYTADHVEGASIAGDLMVNGEICRQYDPVDLCFLELNELMLKHMIELGISPRREED